jgi:hypothetical protein
MASGIGWYNLNKEAYAERRPDANLHWGMTVHCRDTRDPIALGEAHAEALERLEPDLALWNEHGWTVWLAPHLGVRECRRVVGETILTMNDLKAGIMPEDGVAPAAYYLDAWGEKLDEEDRHVPPYIVPYRAMVPRGYEGILTAGKCISGTHIAMSSYRVQPMVANIGQAAGEAAAMAASARTGTREIDLAELRRRLIANGQPIDRWEAGRIDLMAHG